VKLKTPKSKKTFFILFIVAWVGVLLAEALAMYLYLQLPHDSNGDSPAVAIFKWQQMAKVWLIVAPLFVLILFFALKSFCGDQKLFQFNENRKIVSVISWFVTVCLAQLFVYDAAICLITPWFADDYKLTYFLSQLPVAFNNILMTYVLLSANAEIIGKQ